MFLIKIVISTVLMGCALATHAHVPSTVEEWAWQMDTEWWVIVLMLLSLGLYLLGSMNLWKQAGYGRGLSRSAFGAFCVGWVALAIALVSPLSTLGSWLFSAHMLQHEILMIVAAPLMVLGKPFAAWTWAFPFRWRLAIGDITHLAWISQPWKVITHPLNAWVLHAAALWLWHIPAFFEAALLSNTIHVFQHVSFLLSALLFWWSVIGKDLGGNSGWAILSIFTTMLHTGALGVLLTLSPEPWYTVYDQTGVLGLSALEDQQLGGLIMWVPAGLAYLIAGLGICGWLVKEKLHNLDVTRY